MKAFLGSMTGRVFATLLLGILISAALTQWLADVERQRVLERARDQTLIERAETLIMATEIVPASSRRAYLAVANRPGLQLEVGAPHAVAPRPSNFARTLSERMARTMRSRPPPARRRPARIRRACRCCTAC